VTIVDFHNHVMPGVDDGASSDEEAGDALRAFLAQNARHVVATPHVNGSLTLRADAIAERLAELDRGWERLQAIAAARAPALQIYRGAEVMLDTPNPDLGDARLRLAGTAFALCEYPFMTVPPNSTGVLRTMQEAGVIPVIAHPERYVGVSTDCMLASRWRHAGALLQINAGSLTGRYGETARDNAIALLENGLVDYLCSDYHARGRPSTSSARRILTETGGEEHFQMMAMINPRRLLDGEMPVPVPPLRMKRSVADKVRRWFR
jgi:protein-tyrosine phosphatase